MNSPKTDTLNPGNNDTLFIPNPNISFRISLQHNIVNFKPKA